MSLIALLERTRQMVGAVVARDPLSGTQNQSVMKYFYVGDLGTLKSWKRYAMHQWRSVKRKEVHVRSLWKY